MRKKKINIDVIDVEMNLDRRRLILLNKLRGDIVSNIKRYN